MKVGAFVVRRNRWSLGSRQLGVVVSIDQEKCIVLWALKGSYRLQEHCVAALSEVDDHSEEDLESRGCIST